MLDMFVPVLREVGVGRLRLDQLDQKPYLVFPTRDEAFRKMRPILVGFNKEGWTAGVEFEDVTLTTKALL